MSFLTGGLQLGVSDTPIMRMLRMCCHGEVTCQRSPRPMPLGGELLASACSASALLDQSYYGMKAQHSRSGKRHEVQIQNCDSCCQ